MIWFALLIPVVALAVLAIKFPKQTNLVEYIIAFVIPVACIAVGKYASVYTQTKDLEYWNSYGTYAIYEEAWKERWEEQHTETTTDSKGNTSTRTYWTTEYANHPEKWTLVDNIRGEFRISRNFFEQICQNWGMRKFKEMDRKHTSRNRRESSHKILKDGDAYESKLPSIEFKYIYPICKQHKYKNKVQCSRSLFNFEEVSEETKSQYKLFNYPPQNIMGFRPVLGDGNAEANNLLRYYNSIHGSRKQLHMMLLVFKDQPLEAGLFQESYWKGGNKNEFTVCVGVKDGKIKWTRVISWTDNEIAKVSAVREIKEMVDFDPVKIVNYMGENVPNKFIRKEFADFDYIAVEPTQRAIIWTYIVTTISTLIIFLVSIMNSCGFGTFVNKHNRRRQPSRFRTKRKWNGWRGR